MTTEPTTQAGRRFVAGMTGLIQYEDDVLPVENVPAIILAIEAEARDTSGLDGLRERLEAVIRKSRDERPEVVCLCGSTRFYDEFQQANYELTMAGKIVLSVGFYPHAKAQHGHGEGVGHDSSEKVALDELHKRKIDIADRVLVLNVGGYIGQSTRSEIDYAIAHGKPVDYLAALHEGGERPKGRINE